MAVILGFNIVDLASMVVTITVSTDIKTLVGSPTFQEFFQRAMANTLHMANSMAKTTNSFSARTMLDGSESILTSLFKSITWEEGSTMADLPDKR